MNTPLQQNSDHGQVAGRLTQPVRLEDVPRQDWDYNDWGKWGDGNWYFYDGNEMDGHRVIAVVAANPGYAPHWNGSEWEWQPNAPESSRTEPKTP